MPALHLRMGNRLLGILPATEYERLRPHLEPGPDAPRITVLDRPGLEARACECYGVVKKESDRLLPDATAT